MVISLSFSVYIRQWVSKTLTNLSFLLFPAASFALDFRTNTSKRRKLDTFLWSFHLTTFTAFVRFPKTEEIVRVLQYRNCGEKDRFGLRFLQMHSFVCSHVKSCRGFSEFLRISSHSANS